MSNSLCVFSLGKKSKMFSEDSWVNTHLDIFRSAIYAGYNQIFKNAPSQPHSDFEFLKSISNRMGLDLILVNGHPTVVSKKFNNFITILTSAGQHAIHENKSVCCYAVKKMRFEVKKFGNDPFPYQNLDADEILDIRDLKQWLLKFKNVKPIQKENIKKNRLLRLEEIILEIE